MDDIALFASTPAYSIVKKRDDDLEAIGNVVLGMLLNYWHSREGKSSIDYAEYDDDTYDDQLEEDPNLSAVSYFIRSFRSD